MPGPPTAYVLFGAPRPVQTPPKIEEMVEPPPVAYATIAPAPEEETLVPGDVELSGISPPPLLTVTLPTLPLVIVYSQYCWRGHHGHTQCSDPKPVGHP